MTRNRTATRSSSRRSTSERSGWPPRSSRTVRARKWRRSPTSRVRSATRRRARSRSSAGSSRTRSSAPFFPGSVEARLRIVAAEPEGPRIVERLDGTIDDLLASHGMLPLPPYIARHAQPTAEDRERYQTVYARSPGSVAAPTAGLHFTPSLLDRLRARSIEVHALILKAYQHALRAGYRFYSYGDATLIV